MNEPESFRNLIEACEGISKDIEGIPTEYLAPLHIVIEACDVHKGWYNVTIRNKENEEAT